MAGTLKIPYTGSLVGRFNELNQRLADLAALDIPGLIDALFPDGNPENDVRSGRPRWLSRPLWRPLRNFWRNSAR